MPDFDPKNKLNELNAKEWLKFTKTWFIHNPPPRKKDELLHPAKYPENMIEEFVKFFTKPGEIVFDPFLGTGSTLVACHNSKRNGLGIELQKKYADIAKERLKKLEGQLKLGETGARQDCKQLVIQENSTNIKKIWQQYKLPMIDLVITSPPYGMMLNKKSLAAKEREDKDLDTNYSNDEDDLGNSQSYENFLERLINIFIEMKPKIKDGAYLVVILQNYMHKGNYITLAWDFAKEMTKHYQLRGERIWCQDNKTLYPYGYRYGYVPNVHHQYCLIFKKLAEENDS